MTQKIGLLLCGEVPDEMVADWGQYAPMFHDVFKEAGSNIEFVDYYVADGQFPNSIKECDGYLISGSKYSVYEPIEWITQLLAFVADAVKEVPVVGICFGHQVIAQALGGKVEKSVRGWGLGVGGVALKSDSPLGNDKSENLDLLVVHQDQVVTIPEGFTTYAGNEFCPNFIITDNKMALGIQGHPEFSAGYCRAIIDVRKDDLTEDEYTRGMESLSIEPASQQVISQIDGFFAQYK